MDYFAHDELDRVIGSERLQSPLGTRNVGGEYDPFFQLPEKTRRKLSGAGMIVAAPYGERADVLADIICREVAGIETIDDALAWYFKMCSRYMLETRRMSYSRRYKRRVERAAAKGYDSYWQHRQVRSIGLD